MRAKATIRLRFSSENRLTLLLKALMPETRKIVTKRSKVKLTKESEFMVLTVEAKDTVALRAVLNSYLRWIDSTINVLDALDRFSLQNGKDVKAEMRQ